MIRNQVSASWYVSSCSDTQIIFVSAQTTNTLRYHVWSSRRCHDIVLRSLGAFEEQEIPHHALVGGESKSSTADSRCTWCGRNVHTCWRYQSHKNHSGSHQVFFDRSLDWTDCDESCEDVVKSQSLDDLRNEEDENGTETKTDRDVISCHWRRQNDRCNARLKEISDKLMYRQFVRSHVCR